MKPDDERQALLGGNESPEIGGNDVGRPHRSWLRKILPRIHVTDQKYRFLPLVGCLLVLVNEGEYFFKQIGYFRGVEALYCIQYYQQVDPEIAKLGKKIPEAMCKVDDINKNVATANGMVVLIRMMAAFLGTMPLGYCADRFGRRYAQIMHKIGVWTYTVVVLVTYVGYPAVPIWVSFFGGLGGLVGSNIDLNLSVMLAAYTDAMTEPTQIASYFFITTSMQFVGQVVFPLAAGKVINLDGQGGTPEVSLYISLVLASLNLLIVTLFWPETLNKGKQQESLSGEEPQPTQPETTQSSFFAIIKANSLSFWSTFQYSVRGVGTLNLIFLAISMFLATSAIKSVDWVGLIQYPVIKFGWQYSQSTYAMAIQAFVYILTYFYLLPSYTKLGTRFGFTPSSTSFIIMLFSLVFLEAGAVFLGLSASALQFILATSIYTLGAGMPTVMQAFIANLVEKSALGKLMAIISLFQVAGKVCASGLGPIIIKAGIDSGNEALKGSIFFFAAILFLCSASGVGVVALRSGVTERATKTGAEEDGGVE